jgi:uncharacterized OB-fold protein
LTASQVPIISSLVLHPEPHLVARECVGCGARFFGRRAACASCFGLDFRAADVATEGEVVAFTIVAFAMPGVEVPYIAATVDCGGTTVQANIVGVEPTPDHLHLGQKVRLTTYSLGLDTHGTEAVGFGFTPMEV